MRTKIFPVVLMATMHFFSIGQSDSSDLSFITVPVQLETLEDSLLYMGGDYEEVYLAFEMDDLAGFGRVYVEFSYLDGAVIYRRRFDLASLDEAGFIDGSLVNIYLGNFETSNSYAALVMVENSDGLMAPVITKTYLP